MVDSSPEGNRLRMLFLHYLSYNKAERAGTVVRVSPRGTSEGLSWDDPLRDYISARRILKRGLKKLGQGLPFEPAERRPILHITASSVIVGQVPSIKQEPNLAVCHFSEVRRSHASHLAEVLSDDSYIGDINDAISIHIIPRIWRRNEFLTEVLSDDCEVSDINDAVLIHIPPRNNIVYDDRMRL